MFNLILIPFSILISAYYFKKMKRSNIGILFGTFWSIQITLCLLLLNDVNWSYLGIIWILCVVFFFSMGFRVKFSSKRDLHDAKLERNFYINPIRTRCILLLLLFIGFLYVLKLISRYGFSLNNLLNLSSLLDMSSNIAEQRYSGLGEDKSTLDTILLVFLYLGPMIGGYAINFFSKKYDKILCVSTLLPQLMVLLIENTKAGIVACVIFWASSYYVSYLKKNGYSIVISKKWMLKITILLIVLIMLLAFSMLLRIGEINTWSISIVKDKFLNYLFGHIVAFDLWLGKNIFTNSYTFGATTFLGISKYLGFERVIGVYQDVMGSGGISSNVYTYFRGIITDFGVLFGIVLFFLLGILAKYLNNKIILSKKDTSVSESLLIMLLSCLTFFFVSIFTYTSYVVAFFILPIVLKIIKHTNKVRG